MRNVQKAFEITDAKISFVSLVDKAANKKAFLITKAEDGEATFSTYGRIVKTDTENHYLTGIVYEPMVEDAHGNYMTEEEITKAAYGFAKHGTGIDLQHNFEAMENASVVESWVAKADFECEGQTVKKGTWLMTVEVADKEVWSAVEKGEITGFSMGGVGIYSEEDVTLQSTEVKMTETDETEKKGLFKRLAGLFGLDVVEKGEMAERFDKTSLASSFWNAFHSLEETLYRYDQYEGHMVFEENEEKIREALEDFSGIITNLLTKKNIAKSLADGYISKAGKQLSAKNLASVKSAYDALGKLLAAVTPADAENNTEEVEVEMTKQEIEKMVEEAVTKAMEAATVSKTEETTPAAETAELKEGTAIDIEKMVEEAVAKALKPKAEEVTPEDIAKMVETAVSKAIEPILKSRGVPTNIDGEGAPVNKSKKHYLTGIL